MAIPVSHSQSRRLSVAMLVRDEADVLPASIDSAGLLADEIVVLDTGSRDSTSALAQKLGATVHSMPWADDFSAARNRLLDQVQGDWILWLDAGETVDAESAAELRTFLDTKADPGKIYMIWVEMPSARSDGSPEQAAQVRLMPKNPKLRFAGRVCETVRGSIESAGLELDAIPGRIRCHRHRHDPKRKARTARRNLRLIELEPADSVDRKARLLVLAGEAHTDLGDQIAAKKAFSEAIEVADRGSLEMLEGYYGLLTTLSTDPDPAQQSRQLSLCLEALDAFPLDAQLLCAMANYLQNHDRLDLAARTFETAVAHGQVNVETWHLLEIAELASTCLALTLRLQGKDDEARQALVEGLGRKPDSTRLRTHLLQLHIHHGRVEESIRLAEQLASDPARREAFCLAVRGACHAARQNWEPALECLQKALVTGCDGPLCLRWLTVALLSNSHVEAAEPVVQRWLQHEPENAEALQYLAMIEQSIPSSVGIPPSLDEEVMARLRIDSSQPEPEPASSRLPDRVPNAHPEAV